MINKKSETNIIASYKEDCSISKEDFIKKYKVSEKGLSNKEANSRIQNLGLNEIKKSKPKKWYNKKECYQTLSARGFTPICWASS